MSIEWSRFDIKISPKDVSLLFYGKVEIESDDLSSPNFYFESALGMVSEEDDRLVINFDNPYTCFNPTHYAEINWPDD